MRNRLTAKTLVAETKSDGTFSGEIGNPERAKFYHDRYEYDNYDFKKGWDLPDEMDIDDKRDEIGFGISRKVARSLVARKAVTLAAMTLGSSASEKDVEAQARVFMPLGYRRLCAAISNIVASDECPECEEKKEEKAEEAPAAPVEAAASAPVAAAPAPEVKAETCPECGQEVPEAPKACEAPVACEAPKACEEAPKAPEAPVAAAPAPEAPAAVDAGVEELTEDENAEPEMTVVIPPAGAAVGAEIFDGDTELAQTEADPELEAAFRQGCGDETAPVAQPVQASRKVGLKHMAAQPRLASSDTSEINMLADIWRGQQNPRI